MLESKLEKVLSQRLSRNVSELEVRVDGVGARRRALHAIDATRSSLSRRRGPGFGPNLDPTSEGYTLHQRASSTSRRPRHTKN